MLRGHTPLHIDAGSDQLPRGRRYRFTNRLLVSCREQLRDDPVLEGMLSGFNWPHPGRSARPRDLRDEPLDHFVSREQERRRARQRWGSRGAARSHYAPPRRVASAKGVADADHKEIVVMSVDIASALSRQGRRVVLGRRCIPQVGGGLAFESLIRGDPVLSVSLAENAAAPDDPKQSNNGNPQRPCVS